MSILIPTDYTDAQLLALHSTFTIDDGLSNFEEWKANVERLYLSNLDTYVLTLLAMDPGVIPRTIALLLSLQTGRTIKASDRMIWPIQNYVFTRCNGFTLREALDKYSREI